MLLSVAVLLQHCASLEAITSRQLAPGPLSFQHHMLDDAEDSGASPAIKAVVMSVTASGYKLHKLATVID